MWKREKEQTLLLTPLSFSPFLSLCLPTSSHCLYAHSFIRHLSHWYEGPGQHCDMLRRQYKYLISSNGNRHRALIAPHIIWGAVSAADIPFDPPSVCPSPLPFTHRSLFIPLFMQFILGHMSLSDLTNPPLLPSCLLLSLACLADIFLSTHCDVAVCLCSPP